MNTHIITWSEFYSVFGSEGTVNGKRMFIIQKRNKRIVKYELLSYPFRNGVFAKANNTKKLFTHTDLETVKKEADKYLKLMASFFVQSEPCDDATLIMLTMYHKQANLNGISIEEIDVLRELGRRFELKYKELRPGGKDWEKTKIGWEDAVIEFYNKHKPENWNRIV